MKATFFAICDPTWTIILAPKGPSKEFCKQHFSQEIQKLYYFQFCDFKTQFFAIFDSNQAKILASSNVSFLAIFVLNFDSSVFATTTFCFKRYSPNKKWKKPIDNACFFTFFTTLGITWPKFCPKTTPTLIFFCWYPIKYVKEFN